MLLDVLDIPFQRSIAVFKFVVEIDGTLDPCCRVFARKAFCYNPILAVLDIDALCAYWCC